MATPTTGRLETLDAMRGVAALLVVLFHFGVMAPGLATSGYLAVDFFFALSGFVIARTYDARIAGGLGVAGFIERRLIRLYPLYLIGLLLGLGVALARLVTHEEHAVSPLMLLAETGLGAFMLPGPSLNGDNFPLNGPAWSLFFEMAANIVYGIFALSLGRRGLTLLVLAAAIGLAGADVMHGNLEMGSDWSTLTGGLFRLMFAFSIGVLLHRLGVVRGAGPSWWALAPILVLFVALQIPAAGPARAAYDLVFALLISPALVIWGARHEPPPILAATARVLGEISYPLYAIHFPLIFAAGFVAKTFGVASEIWLPMFVAGVIVAALLISRLLDRPIRARVTAWRRARTPAGTKLTGNQPRTEGV